MNDHSAPFGRRFVGPGFAVGAALLFGVSTPFAKEIGQNVNPWLLAGLLYLGSGIGLAAWRLARGAAGVRNNEAALKQSDLRWLAAIVFFGGVAAPLFLMFGLQATPGSTASLLLNLEGLATMAIAWIVYRESVDRRLLLGALAILAGAVALSWDFSTIALSGGALLTAIACLCWGIDNNLTRKLSSTDPVQIAMIKGLAAGATNVILGFATGAELPTPSAILSAGVVGVFGYGISLVLFVLALRELGAARTGAYFSTAPFIGALIAVIVFGEPVTAALIIAAILMGSGVWLHLSENHEHWHEHELTTHEHAHVHDAHHRHDHGPGDPIGAPHTHVHMHEPLRHKHPHYPDLHHRHGH
jgi:drug/metabolite transporter (DMT)-like permease